MTDKIILELPELLKKHLCTLKKASTDTTNKISMCNSNLKVIDFDKLPREFARKRGWCGMPTSNDALYIDVYGKWYFIEFKNGTIPSMDKRTHGFAPQICDSAALLSLSVRPVRFVPVSCRITNLWRKTPSDPKYRLLVAGKATE